MIMWYASYSLVLAAILGPGKPDNGLSSSRYVVFRRMNKAKSKPAATQWFGIVRCSILSKRR